MIVFDALKAMRFAPVVETYAERDSMLYALGLNIAANPLDADGLRYAAAADPVAVPTFPMTLARLGPWMRDPAVGIDYSRIVVGEVALRLFAPIPAAATVRGEHRVLRVTDKGEGRGALVTVLRELRDEATGRLLAEFEQLTFCRADGGFARDGRHDPPEPPAPWSVGERPPDAAMTLQTAANQALIYRLSGDYNPLHSDPEAARKAGFERPILHGLASMGMAGYALNEWARKGEGKSLKSLRGRLAAPVFPGERLRLDAWRESERLLFRVRNEGEKDVVSLGVAEFHYMG